MLTVLSYALSIGAVVSAVFVVTASNPVISVVLLIAVLLNVAGYLVLLGIAYLGLVYVIIYVGAVAILFLFVVMMLDIRVTELRETGRAYTQSIPIGTIVAVVAALEVLSLAPTSYGVASLPFAVYSGINTFLLPGTPTVVQSGAVHVAYNPVAPDLIYHTVGHIEAIGIGLYTYASLWLVIGSMVLLLSMVGPIVLCMTPNASNVQN